jgi:hypothetical protein
MYMETHSKRPDWPVLALGAVIMLVALIAAVTVISGSTATAETTQSPQLQTLPVQDSEARPVPEQGEQRAPGDREDCPGKDGGGDGAAQPESQSPAPDSGSATPEV